MIDLGGFSLLVTLAVAPWLAKAGSSPAAAVTAVYLLVTRYAFGADRRLWTYVVFVAWCASVIVVSSTAIQVLAASTGVAPLVWKLTSIPFTFAANFCFSLLLFKARPVRALP